MTDSMQKAMNETERRRQIQTDYNTKHGITPTTVKKRIREGIGELFDGHLQIGVPQDKKVEGFFEKFHKEPSKIELEIEKLRDKMKKASERLEFEEAAKIRDDIKRLQILDLNLREAKSGESV